MARVNYQGTVPTSAEYFPKNSWIDVSQKHSIGFGLLTDSSGTLVVEFSPNQHDVDSIITYTIVANRREVHLLKRLNSFIRYKFTYSSAPSFFRLETFNDDFNQLTSGINSLMQSDADASIVRPVDFNILVAEGLYENRNVTIKDGYNPDVRSGSVPEDIWGNGGVYTGFPTATTEQGQLNVAGADTGTVFYSYLETATSTDYVFGSKAITGSGTYDLGHNIYRCNYALFQSSNATAFNAGQIDVRWKTTTATIFCSILAGVGQSYCAAYTVPYNSTAFIDRITATIRGSNSASLDGYFWYRPYGGSPYLRFPFTAQYGMIYFDDVDYLIRLPSQVDLIPRITSSSSASATAVTASFRVMKVKS